MSAEDTFYYAKLSQLGVEEWQDIAGYEGHYKVSNLGRVKSLDRIVPHNYLRSKKIKGKTLALTPVNGGYLKAHLWIKNSELCVSVHSLVAKAFIGQRPEGLECCHGDGDPSNNRLFNLRWDTPKNNQADRIKHGTSPKGSNNPCAKLTDNDVHQIKTMLREGDLSQLTIGKIFGVAQQTIGRISLGKTWTHVK